MKYILLFLTLLLLFEFVQIETENYIRFNHTLNTKHDEIQGEYMVKVIVSNKEFLIKLNNSQAAKQFKEILPLTLTMKHVNGNEVFQTLDYKFDLNNRIAGNIQSGDLKIWAGDGLVLFYKNFNSSYAYTDLGKMVDSTGLEAALKQSNQVTFMQE